MKNLLVLCSLLLGLTPAVAKSKSVLHDFITAHGDRLMEGKKPFRFVSFNIPNLHYVEDNVRFELQNPFRLPDAFEINDALETVCRMGGQVARSYTLSVVRTNDPPDVPRYVLGPGKFNEDAFRTLDLVLQVANEKGVRVILPFVDNWSWWGGIAEYAGFRGKPREAFWTDPEIMADFKETIRFVVTRTNTLTGVPYRDDKAILCWETGNELQSPPDWTREIAGFIKSLDYHHLVMDGYHATQVRPESLEMPELDIVTTHHYPGGRKSYAELVRENCVRIKGKKVYIIGEFGFVDTPAVADFLKTLRESNAAGALIWSLRPRNRDGGFYWHSEPAGGNKYKAYHWPGFASGAEYDEKNLLTLLRREAFAIRGLPAPAATVPAAPYLLPIFDVGSISWQGSVGAKDYVVERSRHRTRDWELAGVVDESTVQYRPLFSDSLITPGSWYYRVVAGNRAGVSVPSNVVGPISVRNRTIVDDMTDPLKLYEYKGTVTVQTHDCRKAKEDAHRLAGSAGCALIYNLPGALERCRLDAFFPGAVADFRVSLSANGVEYFPLPLESTPFFAGAGDYDYWKNVRYETKSVPARSEARILKIEFTGEAQIGRVELTCGF